MTNYDILKEYEAHQTPVPTFEEWQQLKELLKEIRSKIKTVYDMDLREFITSAVFDDSFVTKIDEVLR